MQPVVQAVLLSWSIPPVATFAIVLTAFTYLRGAWLLRRAGYPDLPAWRITTFLLGLFALWFALASPLDTFSSFVLTAHMLQHMTLMMVAPPLLLLGEPLIPIVRGMPRFAAREFAGPFLNWRFASRLGLFLIICGTGVFRSPALSLIRCRSKSVRLPSTGRPGRGWSHHVGGWFAGLFVTGRTDRD